MPRKNFCSLLAVIDQAVSEEKIFENVNGPRTDAGRTPDHGYSISSRDHTNSSVALSEKEQLNDKMHNKSVKMTENA